MKIKKSFDTNLYIDITNPVDIITQTIIEVSGFARERVFGTGTLLDTARCRKLVANVLDIDGKSVDLFVVGEHGNSSVILFSAMNICGFKLDEYISEDVGTKVTLDDNLIRNLVRSSAERIQKGKGYTAYGVAAAATKIVSAILKDSHEILPVSVLLNGGIWSFKFGNFSPMYYRQQWNCKGCSYENEL